MLLWFAGASFVIVWMVFKSPALDYRLVMLGAVAPVGETLAGGPWFLHTLVVAVGVLALVVLATRGRRLLRRRWIGLPIGLLLHLALDGSFTQSGLFWWPFLGGGEMATSSVLESSWGMRTLVLDLVGAVGLWWAWRTFGLADRDRRRRFVRTGQLDRALARGAE